MGAAWEARYFKGVVPNLIAEGWYAARQCEVPGADGPIQKLSVHGPFHTEDGCRDWCQQENRREASKLRGVAGNGVES